MFFLCILALMMLHRAILKVLQMFFDNFQSDFRGQEVTSNLQTNDVEKNTEILQFNISALYQLPPSWMTKYVCIYKHTLILKHVSTDTNVNHIPQKNTGFYCFFFLYLIFSFECFSISCELTYGGRKICDTGISENISTALSYGNKIQCNRM